MDRYFGYTPADNTDLAMARMPGEDTSMYPHDDGSSADYTPTLDPTKLTSADTGSSVKRLPGDSVEKVYWRIMGQSPGKIREIAHQWWSIYEKLGDIGSALWRESNALQNGGDGDTQGTHYRHGWHSPAADAFLARGPGATIKSLDDWSRAAYNNAEGLYTLADMVDGHQTTIEGIYQDYKEHMATYSANLLGGLHIRSLDELANGTDYARQYYVDRMRNLAFEWTQKAWNVEHAMAQDYWSVTLGNLNQGTHTIYEGPHDAVVPPSTPGALMDLSGLPGGVPGGAPGLPGGVHPPAPPAPPDPSTMDKGPDLQLAGGPPTAPTPPELPDLGPNLIVKPVDPVVPVLPVMPPGVPGGGPAGGPGTPPGIGGPLVPPLPTELAPAVLGNPNAMPPGGPMPPSTSGVPLAPPALNPKPKPNVHDKDAAPAPATAPEEEFATGQAGQLPPAPSVLGRRPASAATQPPAPLLSNPSASAPGAIPPVLGGRRPAAEPPAERTWAGPVPTEAEWVVQRDDASPVAPPVLKRLTNAAPGARIDGGSRTAPTRPGATAPVLGRRNPGAAQPSAAELAARKREQEHRAHVDAEYDRIRRVLVDEEAFAVSTPGGPVLANVPERVAPVEPRPTLGAH
jgi:hypothetical protein